MKITVPMPGEKMKAVLDASIREFAANGFEKASTNRIIREAGISKGLLFHYFGSKKNLYLYTLDACVEYYLKYFSDHVKQLSPDLLERITEIYTVKVKMFLETPLMYRIVASTFTDTPPKLKTEVEMRRQRIFSDSLPLFLGGIDRSLFRDNIDQDKAVELVLTSMEALSQKHLIACRKAADRGLNELSELFGELREYIDLLKYGIYKKPEKKRSDGGL